MKQEIFNFAVQIINNSSTKEEAEINIENYCDYLKENFWFEDKNFISSIKNLLNFYEAKKSKLKDEDFCTTISHEKAFKYKHLQKIVSSCGSPQRTRC